MAPGSMISKLPRGYLPIGMSLTMPDIGGSRMRYYKVLAPFRFCDVVEQYTLPGDPEKEVHKQILEWLDGSDYVSRITVH